jgi:hypothetical protein
VHLCSLAKPPAAPAVTPPAAGGEGLTEFLQDKTGVTGAWTLGVGVTAYLISKELYVIGPEVGRDGGSFWSQEWEVAVEPPNN